MPSLLLDVRYGVRMMLKRRTREIGIRIAMGAQTGAARVKGRRDGRFQM